MEKIEFQFSERDRRCAVLQFLVHTNFNATNSTISNSLGIPNQTVSDIRKALKESGDVKEVLERKSKSKEDARKVRDPAFIAKVQNMIDVDPTMSCRRISAELNTSPFTVNQTIKEDLKCKSYRRQTGQLLTEATKERRVLKSLRLLNKLKSPKQPGMLWFFSDEKNFTQDQVHNRQNNRWIAVNNQDVPKVMKTKFAKTVMVFGVISSEGDIMPPHIFESGLKVNTKVYLEVMEQVVVPWCNQVANGRPWVWQQDSAPAHKAKKTQEWLADPINRVYDFVPFSHWPPSSPDCNPCDYFLWSRLEVMTNRTSHNTKDSLIAAIKAAFRDIPAAQIKNACARFRSRLEKVVAAEGGYFE